MRARMPSGSSERATRAPRTCKPAELHGHGAVRGGLVLGCGRCMGACTMQQQSRLQRGRPDLDGAKPQLRNPCCVRVWICCPLGSSEPAPAGRPRTRAAPESLMGSGHSMLRAIPIFACCFAYLVTASSLTRPCARIMWWPEGRRRLQGRGRRWRQDGALWEWREGAPWLSSSRDARNTVTFSSSATVKAGQTCAAVHAACSRQRASPPPGERTARVLVRVAALVTRRKHADAVLQVARDPGLARQGHCAQRRNFGCGAQ